jgi:hypothetical protein
VFGEDGFFVSVHEHGHAYHYKSLEPWGSYSCTGNQHSWTETENLSCAFVEGFADFYSMWLSGDRLTTQPYGGDHGLENNVDGGGNVTNPPVGGDGVRVEAAVAAFLYDLVDGVNEPDAANNSPGGEESFDTATFPASWLADVLVHCRLNGTVSRLDGPDQSVYCLENSTSAHSASLSFSTAWRSYSSLSFDQSIIWPAGYSSSLVRTLWKYNMYGVLD